MGLLEKASRIAGGKAPAAASNAAKKSDNVGIRTAISRFSKKHPLFSIILGFAPDERKRGKKQEYLDDLVRMVSDRGEVIPLAKRDAGRSLILIPESMDRELVAHRIDASLNIKTVVAFDADNPADAMEKLKIYL